MKRSAEMGGTMMPSPTTGGGTLPSSSAGETFDTDTDSIKQLFDLKSLEENEVARMKDLKPHVKFKDQVSNASSLSGRFDELPDIPNTIFEEEDATDDEGGSLKKPKLPLTPAFSAPPAPVRKGTREDDDTLDE